eukprot:5014452-Prymnesium_polylepis.1
MCIRDSTQSRLPFVVARYAARAPAARAPSPGSLSAWTRGPFVGRKDHLLDGTFSWPASAPLFDCMRAYL